MIRRSAIVGCLVLFIACAVVEAQQNGICYIDTACSDAQTWGVRDSGSGTCVEFQQCSELWKCADGPVTGNCGGGTKNCTFSPGCSSDMQDCFYGGCQSYSSCNDRVATEGYSHDPGVNQCSCVGNPPAAGSWCSSNALGVVIRGMGAGQVTSAPAGIDCPTAECKSEFPLGTLVTLSPDPDPGSSFSQWGGSTVCGTGQVTVDSAYKCTAYFSTGQSSGPVGYWPFDGDAFDASGNGYDGTLVGDVSFASGVSGQGAVFDGSGDYVAISGQVAFGNELSICGWVKFSGPAQGNFSPLFHKATNVNLAMQGLNYVHDAEYIHFDIADYSSPWYLRHYIALAQGTWYHLCSTAEPGQVRIYLDGQLVEEGSMTGQFDHGYFLGHFIGGAPAHIAPASSHNGMLDEVYVYDRALSAAEVSDLFGGGPSTPISYVALGDSYSSGEGAGQYQIDINNDGDSDDHPEGGEVPVHESTNTDHNNCDRSAYSWSSDRPGDNPYASAPPGYPDPKRLSVACMGAITDDLYYPFSENHDGENEDEIGQLYHHDWLTNADMVSMTIGGNDVGFASIIKACAVLPAPLCGIHVGVAHQNIDALYSAPGGLRQSYEALKNAGNPDKAVYVLGYPRVITADLFVDPLCANPPLFDLVERVLFANLGNKLNLAIKCAAEAEGVHFVPVDFSRHEACSPIGADWIHYIRPLDIDESFHPNKLGQIKYAEALKNKTSQGIKPNPQAVDPPISNGCDQFETEGVRTVDDFGDLRVEPAIPPPCDPNDGFAPGDEVSLYGSGFEPLSTVAIELYGEGGDYVYQFANAAADGGGELDVVRTIPAAAPVAGPGLFLASGLNTAGGTRTSFGHIFMVPSSSLDSDFDGHPDVCDNCPEDPNFGQDDADADHIGDICDLCPFDYDNDLDGDGLCADVDPCPLDPYNDIDGDGVCGEIDMLHYDDFESGDTSAWSNTTS